MNKYASNIRTFTARNVLEKVIIPPNDFLISNSDWKNQIAQTTVIDEVNFPYNTNGNMFVKRIGLFSNFADGMVLNSPATRCTIQVEVIGVSSFNLSGIASLVAGSKNVSGVGTLFTSELSSNDIIRDGNGSLYIIDSVTNDTTLVLTDYALNTTSLKNGGSILANVAGITTHSVQLSQLNTWYEAEKFIPVALSGNDPTDIIILVTVMNTDSGSDINFLTKSINTDFANDTAIFDVLTEIEYTPV